MSDLIERQAAIGVLAIGEKAINRVLDDSDIVGTARTQHEWGLGLTKAYIEDIKALSPTKSEQQWTPTKESLPKKEGSYLVQGKHIEMPFIAWFGIDPRYPRGNNNCVQKFWCDDCGDALIPLDVEYVLAWMPLPKPYKEDES